MLSPSRRHAATLPILIDAMPRHYCLLFICCVSPPWRDIAARCCLPDASEAIFSLTLSLLSQRDTLADIDEARQRLPALI